MTDADIEQIRKVVQTEVVIGTTLIVLILCGILFLLPRMELGAQHGSNCQQSRSTNGNQSPKILSGSLGLQGEVFDSRR